MRRIFVNRMSTELVGHLLPAGPAAVAELHRHTRHEFLLHRRAELPVEGTDAPAAEELRVEPRGRAGDRAALCCTRVLFCTSTYQIIAPGRDGPGRGRRGVMWALAMKKRR